MRPIADRRSFGRDSGYARKYDDAECRKPDNSCRAACVRRGDPYDRSGVLSHYRRAENIRSGGFHGDGGELKTSCNDVRLSTKTNKVTVTYKKTVKPYLNLASGTPSNAEYMDRTNWSGTLGEGVENVIGNIFDGNTGSDIAANSAPWEFTLDLGAETTMLGANTRHWGSGYAPRSIEVLTSPDNATWKSHGTLAVSGGTQNWRFLKPVTARYLRYRVMSPNGRTDVTEFNIYVAKQ